MRMHPLMILAVGLLIAADAPKENATKNEMKKLEGTWRIVSVGSKGKKEPADYSKRFTYTFKGDTVRFLGDNTTPGADLEYTYTLDATKSPKQIDMKLVKSSDNKGLGQVQRAIYVLEGNTLKMCAGEKKRPTGFAGTAKSQAALVILKREKK
jgi:uncharacterized protein (TIGR03067 family)